MPDSDDSEEDEFSLDRKGNAAAGPSKNRPRYQDDEDEDEDEDDQDDEGEEGMGEFTKADEGMGVNTWEPDDLDGHEEDEDASEEDSEKDSDEDDEGITQAELVSCRMKYTKMARH
jgi:hypothetical protein